ncbi:hypothetical protein, variant 1 [Puccinia striiformis f. sp. tritici PST-78]|uniref:VWFA domain-containing protein n=1 Tax=Puccinia striiformis f. sp. tritici PST-78 TaxID=1165861 RepID=A0A0L0VSQ1_9BASI|nr:hypothetical protein PSTG_04516 [Puccinia striiformis f. sp. tritici PST-78]KNF02310.1 hypothetical protein, variant 1 [Puccinia striiformis f. sp. tritici PST-78]
MPQGTARAISNFVFLPGGTQPISTQANFDRKSNSASSPRRSQDDNLNRTTRKISKKTTLSSRTSLDNLLLDGCNSARNCINSLGYLNLPQPILNGINQISSPLNRNYNLASGTTNVRPASQLNQRPARISGSHNSPARLTSPTKKQSLLAALSKYHTIFLVDDSASMSVHGLWKEARDALSAAAATAVQHTPDGIDIYFLNTNKHLRHARTPQAVNQLFSEVQPNGACTPVEVRIEALVSYHLDQVVSLRAQGLPRIKPLNLVVITDGVTDDPETLVHNIINIVDRLEDGQFPLNEVGIQFIQVGFSSEATKLLRTLDNDLKKTYGVKRDIVDTTPYKGQLTGEFVLKCLLGGINRRIDKGK